MPTFGTSSLPKLLPYPGYQPLHEHFVGIYCYILRHPGPGHVSLLLRRDGKEGMYAQFGDWAGNSIDINDDRARYLPVRILETYFQKLVALLRVVGIPQAQFYFTDDLQLLDVRVAANKFIGPGMLKDIFGKSLVVPETIAIEVLDERVLNGIRAGVGSYGGDLLIKPSRYRDLELPNGSSVPLYAAVRR